MRAWVTLQKRGLGARSAISGETLGRTDCTKPNSGQDKLTSTRPPKNRYLFKSQILNSQKKKVKAKS